MENETKQTETTSIQETESPIAKAEAILKRIEEVNAKTEANLRKNEELLAKSLVSGRSLAGLTPQKPQEETPLEYARRISAGRL